MAAGAVKFKKIPLGEPDAPVTAEVLDRVQQAIVEMASGIKTPSGPNVVSISSDYQVTGLEDVLHVDSQRGPVTVTLLQPSSSNRPITIKQTNLQNGKSKVNTVTVRSADGKPTISGLSSLALDATGTGSVSLTSDNAQHWPSTDAGGNPPVPVPTPGQPPGGLVYIGLFPIKIVGNVISFVGTPAPPAVVPWVAPVPFGGTGPFNDSSGNETWKAECMVDFTGAPSSLTAYFWFESQSAGGSATYNIRVGGSAFQALDGTVVATFSDPTSTLTPHSVASVFAPPAGLQRVTLTMQSAGVGQAAKLGYAPNLQFR